MWMCGKPRQLSPCSFIYSMQINAGLGQVREVTGVTNNKPSAGSWHRGDCGSLHLTHTHTRSVLLCSFHVRQQKSEPPTHTICFVLFAFHFCQQSVHLTVQVSTGSLHLLHTICFVLFASQFRQQMVKVSKGSMLLLHTDYFVLPAFPVRHMRFMGLRAFVGVVCIFISSLKWRHYKKYPPEVHTSCTKRRKK